MLPDRASRTAASLVGLVVILSALYPPALTQAAQSDDDDPWYRIEILVFRQPGNSGLGAEAWAPEPSLSYPSRHRYLIDRDLADDRHKRFTGSRSQIDTLGVQTLLLPEPRSRSTPVLETLAAALPPGDDIPSASPVTPAAADSPQEDIPATPEEPEEGLLEGPPPVDPPRADARLDLDNPEIPLPPPPAFTLLPEGLRELNRDAARMRSAGYDVLMHGAWVQPVASESETRSIILDRSGDPDSDSWPALQGSVTIYLSRYLHINTRLWLNTPGDYLHPDWRMPEPPRAPSSVRLSLPDLKDWYEQRLNRFSDLEVARPDGQITAQPALADNRGDGEIARAGEQQDIDSDYPWRHALLLEQSRRMRGGELHYIDHPVLGVLIKMTLLDDADWVRTYRETLDWQWEDRHSIVITGREGITLLRENRP